MGDYTTVLVDCLVSLWLIVCTPFVQSERLHLLL